MTGASSPITIHYGDRDGATVDNDRTGLPDDCPCPAERDTMSPQPEEPAMTELVYVPYELTEQFGSVENYKTWAWYGDRHATHWAATPYRHHGDQVMMLLDGDDECFATRTSLEAVRGPLAEVPHCTACGDYFWYRNGICRTLACTQA